MINHLIKPKFGGHEKFVFRYGWLKKGFNAVLEDPYIFSNEDALIQLGVGKNMVKSIRYWCLATGVLKEKKSSEKKIYLEPTTLGNNLLGDNGWDPYLENYGSLWLLHWHLANNLEMNFVWHLLFSVYLETEFSRSSIQKFISNQFEKNEVNTTTGTIQREIDVCIRTYIPAQTKKGKWIDETYDCPLAELELLKYLPDEGVYQINTGPKNSLSTLLYGFSLLNFLSAITQNRQTISIDECVYNHHSPGQIFKLDENTSMEYIEQLEKITNGEISLQETAGLTQIYVRNSFNESVNYLVFELLKSHYELQ